jgi:hypothetical protein
MFARVAAFCAVLFLLSTVQAVAQSAPSITSLSPSVGPVPPAGGPVTIQGTNFGAQTGTVTFGGTAVSISSWSDQSIVVNLPVTLPVGFLNVIVTANGLPSNAKSFLLIPTILGVTPPQATVGTPVTIGGTSFGSDPGTVTFNGITAPTSLWANTSITVPVPLGAADGTLTVTVNGFQTNGYTFFIVPNILSLSPNTGPVDTPVTISGNGFGAAPGFGGVTFNGVNANIIGWNDSTISVTVPPGATVGTDTVVVTASSLLAGSGVNFTVGAPLTIQASTDRPSNSAGWYNAPATVSFQCSGGLAPVTCPQPQTVSGEGANQTVSGTATDAAGNTASASLTVSIDKTPPTIALATPLSGTVINRPVARITGATSDALSGIAGVTCNGAIGSVSSGSFACDVPLVAGSNLVQAQASDNAGNTANSSQISITYSPIPPTAIFITPPTANMAVGQTRTVALVGNAGQIVAGAAWSISDPTIVSITTADPPQLIAVAAGSATLTANFGSLTATMTVNVLSGTALPVGTPVWSQNPAPGSTITAMLRGNPINPGDPDIFAVESSNTLLAYTADGHQLWSVPVARPTQGPSGETDTLTSSVPDNASGTVNTIFRHPATGPFLNSLVRIDNASQQTTWSYDSPGQITGLAIAPDNTVYATEVVLTGPQQGFFFPSASDVVALDGTTGQPRFTVNIPVGHVTVVVDSDTRTDMDTDAKLGMPSVLPDGSVNLLAYTVHLTQIYGICSTGICETSTSDHKTMQLFTIRPDGSLSSQPVHTFVYDVANCQTQSGGCQDPSDTDPVCLLGECHEFSPGDVIPDGQGGILAEWGGFGADLGPNVVGFIHHVTSSGSISDYNSPLAAGTLILGENNAAMVTDGVSVAAFDVNSGAQLWSFQSPGGGGAALLASTMDGGVAAYTTDPNTHNVNAITSLDSSGTSTSFPVTGDKSLSFFDDKTLLATTATGLGELIMAGNLHPSEGVWFVPGGQDNQRRPDPPDITSVSPSSGLVGVETSVTIKGTGFTSDATVDAGPNISVSRVVVSSSTQITASFTPKNSQSAGGDQSVKVKVGVQTGKSIAFFDQVPTSLSVVSVGVLPDGPTPPAGCPGSLPYGIMVDIKYQSLDQHDQPILSAAMTPHENGTFFTGGNFDGDIGPSPGYPTSTKTTAADGTFHDVPVGICRSLPISNPGLTSSQNITMIVSSAVYPVRSQTITVKAPGAASFEHGTMTNSLGDINATR